MTISLKEKALTNHLPIYNQVGRVLPVIARAVMRACFGPDLNVDDSHYNIVQNNGTTSYPNTNHPKVPLLVLF
jgi:hypothetical protein